MSYAIPQALLERSPSVFACDAGGERVFVKKRAPRERRFGHALQNLAWRLTKNPLFIPTLLDDGENPVEFEANMLRLLAERGVDAPKVLHVEQDYFVMSDVGENLERLMIGAPKEERRALIEKAALALRRLHDLGLAWGGAQIRNFSCRDGKIYLFDFEEKIPQDHLEHFKFRDLLIFLFSLERKGFDPDIEWICRLYDQNAPSSSFLRIRRLFAKAKGRGLIRKILNHFKKMKDLKAFLSLMDKADGEPTREKP